MELELPLDFKEFLKLLNEKNVRYLLIGGYAVGYHGYPRATLTILDEPMPVAETALLSEAALAQDWNRPEEDEAWNMSFQNMPRRC